MAGRPRYRAREVHAGASVRPPIPTGTWIVCWERILARGKLRAGDPDHFSCLADRKPARPRPRTINQGISEQPKSLGMGRRRPAQF